MNNKLKGFKEELFGRIHQQGANHALKDSGILFMKQTILSMYSYNFSWLGVPIIQYPQDMIAMQELIWDIKPDLIIETGIAHGGSIIYYASLLEMIGKGSVLGIDIDIRPHNREVIEKHPLFKRIQMLEGSSTSNEIFSKVLKICDGKEIIMVILDSNHTHDYVLKELELFSPLVSVNSYLVVFDTIIEDLSDMNINFKERPWGKGNNPKTAVQKFLKNNNNFIIDKNIKDKLIITVAPDGYLKCVK